MVMVMRTTNLNWFLYVIGYYKWQWEHEKKKNNVSLPALLLRETEK